MIDKSISTGDIIGSFISTGTVNGNISVSSINNVVSSELKQTLAESAEEIQRLLKQLDEINPSVTESQQISYINIVTKPDLKQRTIAALKEGGETAIEEFFLENKYLKVGKAVVKGWLQASI
jgi:H2-forming N5,N10-methylenetetrahydromethanopterin dehydrogenase-like enzyme